MMLRFFPDYNPVVSNFMARTILMASAEPETTLTNLRPVLEKLCC